MCLFYPKLTYEERGRPTFSSGRKNDGKIAASGDPRPFDARSFDSNSS